MNRENRKELPRTEAAPLLKLSVQETVKRAVQKELEAKQLKTADGFLGKFLALFADYSYSTARSHRRGTPAASKRTPKEIAEEVRAFFAARPRPWRPAGHRAKPVYAQRYRYRKNPRGENDVDARSTGARLSERKPSTALQHRLADRS